jgi:hypothetical protein
VPSATLSLQATNGCRINDAARARTCFMRGVCSSGFKVVIRARVRCVGIRLRMVEMGGGGELKIEE